MIRREISIFLHAVEFFTRIPCPIREKLPKDQVSGASRYFPLIGWFVGAVGGFIVWGGNLFFPLPIAVLLSMAATIILTGALHEDGFADACDGFGGGWTKEKILAIMKDSNIGVFGVVGIGMLLGLKFFSLISLSSTLIPPALLSAHSLSRFASISFMYTHQYVREDDSSKAKPLVRRMKLGEVLFAAFFGLLPFMVTSFLFLQWHIFIICLLIVWLVRWLLGRYFSAWVDGYTGDCLGAAQQVTEVVVYLTLVALV
jgi:adenosylcobinamide-GDP ribazoletransferase